MVLLEAGQGAQAVVEGVAQAAVVVDGVFPGHQHGDPAGGDDDGQHRLFQLVGGPARLVVGQSLSAVAHQSFHAHAAEVHAQGLEMLQILALGGYLHLVELGVGVADAGPHVAVGGPGDDIGVDEHVLGAFQEEDEFGKGAVFVIDDGQGRAGGAVGGDGGEGKIGLFQVQGHQLAGIHRLAAAHGEDHVRLPHRFQSFQLCRGGAGAFRAVPHEIHDLYLGAGHGPLQLFFCGGHGLFAADDHGFGAVKTAVFRHFGVSVRPHGIGGGDDGIVFHKSRSL